IGARKGGRFPGPRGLLGGTQQGIAARVQQGPPRGQVVPLRLPERTGHVPRCNGRDDDRGGVPSGSVTFRRRGRIRASHGRSRLPRAQGAFVPESAQDFRQIGGAGCGERFNFVGMRLEDLRDLSAQFDEQYYDIVKLEAVIAAKVSPGGTSPRRVEEQMLAAEKVIAELEDELPAPA